MDDGIKSKLLVSIFEPTASFFLQPYRDYIHLREIHPGVGIVFAWERGPDNIAINIHPSRLKNATSADTSLASCVQVPPDKAWPLVSSFHPGRWILP